MVPEHMVGDHRKLNRTNFVVPPVHILEAVKKYRMYSQGYFSR